jgi:hypothetical protein
LLQINFALKERKCRFHDLMDTSDDNFYQDLPLDGRNYRFCRFQFQHRFYDFVLFYSKKIKMRFLCFNSFVDSMKILLDPIFRSNEHSLLASCPTNLKVIIISPEILKLPSHQKLIIFMTPRCPLFQLRRLSLIICEKLTPTPQSIVSCIYKQKHKVAV